MRGEKHTTIQLHPSRSEQRKRKIAEEITAAIMTSAQWTEPSVSVGIEDVIPDDWVDKVYKTDIIGKSDYVYKKPGYDPL